MSPASSRLLSASALEKSTPRSLGCSPKRSPSSRRSLGCAGGDGNLSARPAGTRKEHISRSSLAGPSGPRAAAWATADTWTCGISLWRRSCREKLRFRRRWVRPRKGAFRIGTERSWRRGLLFLVCFRGVGWAPIRTSIQAVLRWTSFLWIWCCPEFWLLRHYAVLIWTWSGF